jgi:hypothetical protein
MPGPPAYQTQTLYTAETHRTQRRRIFRTAFAVWVEICFLMGDAGAGLAPGLKPVSCVRPIRAAKSRKRPQLVRIIVGTPLSTRWGSGVFPFCDPGLGPGATFLRRFAAEAMIWSNRSRVLRLERHAFPEGENLLQGRRRRNKLRLYGKKLRLYWSEEMEKVRSARLQ